MNKYQKFLKKVPWKTVLYTVLFGFICVINQRIHTASPIEGWREVFRDLTGVVIAVLILSHYKMSEYLQYRKYHLVWTVLGGIGCAVLFLIGKDNAIFASDWLVLSIDFFIWGYVLIQTLLTVFKEKRYPVISKTYGCIWAVMIVLMILSRNEELWPLVYGVMFVCFYLTDYSKEERMELLQGALNGLIASFFVFQGHSFLYRPYDSMSARYVGWYNNPNNNVLYYCFILAAVLVKLYLCRQNNANKWWRLYYWLGIGTVFSYIIMTIGRIGWITAFVLTFIFLIFQKRDFGKTIIKNGLVVILCTVLTFPLCFAAARYIPPIRHHVVWFDSEYSVNKVHSWDPWNSEKFVDIDEFAEAAFGRITDSFGELFKSLPFVINADAADLEARKVPVLEDSQSGNGYLIRKTIYKYFWENLNFTGHTSEEIGFQLFTFYWIGHAHNIYLQFGTQFGIPVMMLFAALLLCGLIKCRKIFKSSHNAEAMCNLYFILIPALFGIFEFTWGAGHMAITLLFIAWRMLLVKDTDPADPDGPVKEQQPA